MDAGAGTETEDYAGLDAGGAIVLAHGPLSVVLEYLRNAREAGLIAF